MFIYPDNRYLRHCYGQSCIHPTDRFGNKTNYFESPSYPQLYEDRLRALYLLYIPGVNRILFEFDPLAYGIEDNRDELYVGAGLEFYFQDLLGKIGTPERIYFFENVNATVYRGNGVFTPRSFIIQGDSVWIYFLTNKQLAFSGWRLYWSIPGRLCFQIIKD